MINYKIQTLSPLPLKGGEPVCGRKSPFKGSRRLSISEYVSDLEGLVFFIFHFSFFIKKW